jgi:hypothetical protein
LVAEKKVTPIFLAADCCDMSKLRLDKIPAQQETFMALLASVDGAMRLVGIWVDAKIDRKMTSLIRKHDDQQ